jgi:hypothetical protein
MYHHYGTYLAIPPVGFGNGVIGPPLQLLDQGLSCPQFIITPKGKLFSMSFQANLAAEEAPPLGRHSEG